MSELSKFQKPLCIFFPLSVPGVNKHIKLCVHLVFAPPCNWKVLSQTSEVRNHVLTVRKVSDMQ